MIELYKGGKSCKANKGQIKLLKGKGWSTKKEVAPAPPAAPIQQPTQAAVPAPKAAPKKKVTASPEAKTKE